MDHAIARWGRIDVLVNNAHTFTDYLPLEDPKMEDNCRSTSSRPSSVRCS